MVTASRSTGSPLDLRQQLEGIFDGVAFEVIAEAEVAQHLEESMVARRGADILEIVVFAADAHTLLRGGGATVIPLVQTEENVP